MNMQIENVRSFGRLLSIGVLSIALHASFLSYMSRLAEHYGDLNIENYLPVHISREDPPAPPVPEVKKDEAVPVKAPIKIPKKAPKLGGKAPKLATQAVKPVLGVPPSELSKNATGMAVPVGNTTMMEDEGKRPKADDVKDLPQEQDLSTQPQLIRSSVEIPEYTAEALDNSIEGTFAIDVYVDASGTVTKAEMKRKIGYGMDERVIAAARNVSFVPGKDRYGKDIAQWTEIKFRLQIP